MYTTPNVSYLHIPHFSAWHVVGPQIFFLFLLIVNTITKAVLDHFFILLMAVYSTHLYPVVIHSQLRNVILEFKYQMFILPALPY